MLINAFYNWIKAIQALGIRKSLLKELTCIKSGFLPEPLPSLVGSKVIDVVLNIKVSYRVIFFRYLMDCE